MSQAGTGGVPIIVRLRLLDGDRYLSGGDDMEGIVDGRARVNLETMRTEESSRECTPRQVEVFTRWCEVTEWEYLEAKTILKSHDSPKEPALSAPLNALSKRSSGLRFRPEGADLDLVAGTKASPASCRNQVGRQVLGYNEQSESPNERSCAIRALERQSGDERKAWTAFTRFSRISL